jgi:hypothetical protein
VWSSLHIPGGSDGFVVTDLDYDHDADVIGCAGTQGIWVEQSLGTAFRDPARWISGNWCGVGPAVAIQRYNGASVVSLRPDSVWELAAHVGTPGYPGWFGPEGYKIYTGVFTSPLGTFGGDVDGDGYADDIIAIHDTEYRVLIGSQYTSALTLWGARPPTVGGASNTLSGDVDGDGDTDLIALDDDGVRAVLNGQGQLEPPVPWSTQAFRGSRTTLAGDVDADGDTDLIALDDDGVRVLPSTGTAFGVPEQWSTQPFSGERATLTGDVDADGDTDLIAIDENGTRVMLAE